MPNLSTSSSDVAQRPLAFVGEFRPIVDGKKRLTIPARWRSGVVEDLFIIKSLTRGCLVAMPQEVLVAMGEKAASQASTMEDHQSFLDQFFSSATNYPVDSQGRMVLSDDLCQFAGVEKETEVVLAGSGAKFDIWTPVAWDRQKQAAAETYKKTLKSLGL